MEYKARLRELQNKNELTEKERAELYHIATMALLEIRNILDRQGAAQDGTNQEAERTN